MRFNAHTKVKCLYEVNMKTLGDNVFLLTTTICTQLDMCMVVFIIGEQKVVLLIQIMYNIMTVPPFIKVSVIKYCFENVYTHQIYLYMKVSLNRITFLSQKPAPFFSASVLFQKIPFDSNLPNDSIQKSSSLFNGIYIIIYLNINCIYVYLFTIILKILL